MSTKYKEVRKGVYQPRNWNPPKHKLDSKRMQEIITKLRAVRASAEKDCPDESHPAEAVHSATR